MGLLACSTAILLLGVVIGRVTAGETAIDDVYLRNETPSSSPTPEPAAATARKDRPPLEPVRRTDAPRVKRTPSVTRARSSRPPNTIDGSAGDDLWTAIDRGLPGETAAGGPEVFPELELEVVRLVNAQRVKRGCRPLRVDHRLVKSARAHSAEMAASRHFDHTSPDGSTAWDRMAAAGYTDSGAETIARGYRTAEEVVQGWMADRRDRATLLNCRLVATGVGVNMGAGGPWWTEDFGYS